MNTMMVRFGLTHPKVLAAALAVLLVCGSTGFSQTPELPKMLLSAQKSHPDILAAVAKLRMAEAELEQARLKVAREVIDFHREYKDLQAEAKMYETHLARGPDKKGFQGALIRVKAKLAALEAKMPFLFGEKVPGAPGSKGQPAGRSYTYTYVEHRAPELPKGPMLELLRDRLGDPIAVEFDDVQLSEIVGFLARHGIPMVFDPALDDAPISLHFKQAPIGALLQAIEDVSVDLRFVIREYGILAADEDSEVAKQGKSAAEFWAEQCGKRSGGKGADTDSTTPADSKSRTPR